MMDIYWLSILDNVQGLLGGAAIISGLGALVLCVIGMIAANEAYRDGDAEKAAVIKKSGFRLILPCIICSILATFLPTRQALIESYMIIEGKEIVNAENADKVFGRVLDRIEKEVE